MNTKTLYIQKIALKIISWLGLIFIILLIHGLFISANGQKLVVYDTIPGRAASDHYICRVKFENEGDNAWREAFVPFTLAKDAEGYYQNVRGWTASWIAFESDFNGNVVVEISKKDGSPITEAMVRPVADASAAVISNGKAYVTFTEPANVNVDINGMLEKNYTGYGYTGPNVHTISLFANPIYKVPDPNNPYVKVLQPGEDINALNRAEWDTLVFAPGVHNLGVTSGTPTPFQILSYEVLFIPGDAVVHGTIHPKNAWGDDASQNFTVYGSGTISGENIVRDRDDQNKIFKPFTYQAEGARLEGFVVADPAFHTFNMGNSRDNTSNLNIYKNLKILGWRVNSDGINAFRYSEVSDCFFRVQDDAFYIGANHVNQHDNVVWNDANGAVLFIQKAPDASTNIFRDVTVIYHRAYWHWWDGGRIISMRQTPSGTTISNVHVRNITVEDPLPAFPPFYATMLSGADNITLNNIVFENIYQEHDGIDTQNTMIGSSKSNWENITFKNCYFNGKTLTSFGDGNFDTTYVDANTVVFEVINAAPEANFSANYTNIFIGETVDFTDLSSNTPTSWNWTFEGGTPTSSTEQHPSVTYSEVGTYNVSLEATNSFGTTSFSQSGYINVSEPIAVTGVSIDNCPESELPINNNVVLTTTISPSDATDKSLIWSSHDPSIATVNRNGLVTGVAAGTATITARTVDGRFTDTCEVVIKKIPVTSVEITNCFQNSLVLDKPYQLHATVLPNDASNKSISWTSSDSSIVSVNDGLIEAHAVGDAIITVITEDGGLTSSCHITTKDAILDINSVTSDMKLYPNPSDGPLHIEFSDRSERAITIFSLLGEQLYYTKTDEQKVHIDLDSLAQKGVILIRVQAGNSIYNHMVIVQ